MRFVTPGSPASPLMIDTQTIIWPSSAVLANRRLPILRVPLPTEVDTQLIL